jgi:hypothetical protein
MQFHWSWLDLMPVGFEVPNSSPYYLASISPPALTYQSLQEPMVAFKGGLQSTIWLNTQRPSYSYLAYGGLSPLPLSHSTFGGPKLHEY